MSGIFFRRLKSWTQQKLDVCSSNQQNYSVTTGCRMRIIRVTEVQEISSERHTRPGGLLASKPVSSLIKAVIEFIKIRVIVSSRTKPAPD